jgi:ArsR family transcriptional regulator
MRIEECCPPVLTAPLSADDAERLAAGFKVLADPARLRLLSLIASAENGELCTCDAVAPLGLTQPTVSHHLKVLYDAGLVEREKRGQWTYYRVAPAPLAVLRGALATG